LGRGRSCVAIGAGVAVGFPLGAADATCAAEAAAEAAADGSGEAVAIGAADAAVVGAADTPVVGAADTPAATESIGTSGVGVFSELHAAADTDAATMTARPLARRAQKGQTEPTTTCRWHRAQGTRSRIRGRVTGMAGGLHIDDCRRSRRRAACPL
jgi:hypothetical protein